MKDRLMSHLPHKKFSQKMGHCPILYIKKMYWSKRPASSPYSGSVPLPKQAEQTPNVTQMQKWGKIKKHQKTPPNTPQHNQIKNKIIKKIPKKNFLKKRENKKKKKYKRRAPLL